MNEAGRITLVNHDRNRGLAASRNTGLRLAKGVYIAYLDDDDRFLPDHLGTLVACLERGEHHVAYSDAWRVIEHQVNGFLLKGSAIFPIPRTFPPLDCSLKTIFRFCA